jgi:hypothetical protein
MEAVLRAQAPDRGMRIEVEHQLAELYATAGFEGTRLDSVECGTTFCRISNRHESNDARSAFVRAASPNPPFNNEIFYTYGEGEPSTTTLYVARPGQRLPR